MTLGPSVLVAGGANLDIKCRADGPVVMRTSNPGTATVACGGVARNVAEHLAGRGAAVRLLTVLGEDAAGERIWRETQAAGVDMSLCLRAALPTGSYTAVLDHEGELVVAVAAMHILDALDTAAIAAREEAVLEAAFIVADANLSPPALARLARLAGAHGRPLALEPVSVAKAARLAPILAAGVPVALMTPNRDELAALAGLPVDGEAALAAATRTLHGRGVHRLAVGLGAHGVFLSTAEGETALLPAPAAGRARDVTGAGDAALAGTVFGLLSGWDFTTAACEGQRMAAAVVTGRDEAVQEEFAR
ncbi:carbohydrate kinase family protein [Chelatococcus daeguensis]|uniref:Carbohydrate kinase PfkB domain-containing protein n=1 Tax=Chelatococcus daeguensis TaxID=444444 RepID=A0AAC9JM89_9HYPH|nr:carbohydrate kinase family protein [Chelatococcus daeguensis]APF36237.1 hypothetical protein BOQ54_01915 [Chelatococcus daeguensis]KZE30560.1 hypothetical protein AVW15_02515 [Chelatococcus daeguensis]MBM3081908.1 carbohydrate kinase family protein [Chelatococcus daeguensis]